MTSAKKLFTIAVEDKYSSNEVELFAAANEALAEYSSIYNWTDVSLSKSSLPVKKIADKAIYYFDVFGNGEAIAFDDGSTSQSEVKTSSGIAAAKEANP